MKKIKDKKLICILAVIFGLSLILIVSVLLLNREIKQYSESSDAHKEIEKFIIKEETEISNENISSNEEFLENSFSVDFEKLKEEAPDVIGWIIQENTNINYPVMHTDNNDYYLNHLYNGTQNKTGSIYVDYENNPEFKDYNTIIYGHNMNDGAMFASLLEYQKQDYYDANKKINLILPNSNYEIEIFTAFVANPNEIGTEKSPWKLEWENYEEYSNWLTNMQNRSMIKNNVLITPGDKVITLSTCTANGKNRFIVMGKLVYIGEN